MKLVRGAWKLLVGIKDALVLAFMLLFFVALFAALSFRPTPAAITDGALLMAIDGTVVEQPEEVDPFAAALGGADGIVRQHRLRDLTRALDAAVGDDRVKAVVLDLDRFMGGYPATVATLADAVGRVRASGKPVLAYATGYTDAGYLLAAHASEIWVNPFGGAMFTGPGGSQLYYKGLIDRLGVTTHVFRVGQFKSAVEPYTRADASPEAEAANRALYGSIFDQWRDRVAKARPNADIAPLLARPAEVVTATGGDIAAANLRARLVDKVGDRVAFGVRVAEIAGGDDTKPAGAFRTIPMARYIAANPVGTTGDAIGVITVAGTIVDGEAAPGTAGGDSVSKLLLDGLAKKNLKALVVRIDSPGGSVLASEQIRQAILQAKAQGLPVVTSMASLAASGGYWVATPGDVIFAEPNTITGSIGVFGVLPSFEQSLARIGVTSDGVQTTPLSGQPDILGGLNPTVNAILQSGVENAYARFIDLVATTRRMTPARVDQIAQGRVWDGGSARQLGLVDRFGGLEDAVREAAVRAKLDPQAVHAVYLDKEPSLAAQFAERFAQPEDEERVNRGSIDLFARLAGDRRMVAAQVVGDLRGLMTQSTVQARCLVCAGMGPPRAAAPDLRVIDLLMDRLIG